MNTELLLKQIIFIRFLKENNAYTQYWIYLSKSIQYDDYEEEILFKEFLIGTRPNELISTAFVYENTNEGSRFWQKINDKWKQIVYEYKTII